MQVEDILIIPADSEIGTSEKEQTIKEITKTEVVFSFNFEFTKYLPDGTVEFTEQRAGEVRMPKTDAEKLQVKV